MKLRVYSPLDHGEGGSFAVSTHARAANTAGCHQAKRVCKKCVEMMDELSIVYVVVYS